MGYYDEEFSSHFVFVLKFFLLLGLLRALAYLLGYTDYVPVLDDIGAMFMNMAKSAAEAAEQIFGIRVI